MFDYKKHLIDKNKTVKEILSQLNELATIGGIVFLVDEEQKLLGSITDGDIRRGFINGLDFDSNLQDFVQANPLFLNEEEDVLEQFKTYKINNIKVVPVLNRNMQVVDVINISTYRSLLPLDAFLMAGGEGSRLRPLTENTPKPLLKVGEKPIIEHNIDRLCSYGIKNISISINYLGEKIESYLGDGKHKNCKINYVKETQPLGTIGSITLQQEWANDYILIMNSDLLTNIDFEAMFNEMRLQNADMIVATVPYEVNIPYGIIEFEDKEISNLVEKPTYTYYSNAGIYIIKKQILNLIPSNQYYNATDLINELANQKDKKVVHFPIYGYWLDIGKHQDFAKAQEDIKHIKW